MLFRSAVTQRFTQELTLKLGPDDVSVQDVRPLVKPGSIKVKGTVGNPRATLARIGSLGLLGLTLVGLVGVGVAVRAVRGRQGQPEEAAVRRLRRKHKDTIVDVAALPPIGPDEKVVRMRSVEELFKAADALLKPVLHQAGPERHTYSVSDWTTRYLYEIGPEGPPAKP